MNGEKNTLGRFIGKAEACQDFVQGGASRALAAGSIILLPVHKLSSASAIYFTAYLPAAENVTFSMMRQSQFHFLGTV